MPDKFLRREMAKKGVELPLEGDYGSGCVFFSPEASVREVAMQVFELVVREEGQKFLGWRTVPVRSELLGKTSSRYEPVIKQIFIGKSPDITDPMDFERKLYVIRKRVGAWIRNNEVPNQFRDVHGNKGNSFPGAYPFLHEYLSKLVASSPKPLHCSQRRNQYRHGQCKLHEGASGTLPIRPFWNGHQEHLPRNQ
jgi:hypothetical protein